MAPPIAKPRTTLVVVPTLRPVQTRSVLEQRDALAEIGDLVVVCNSAEAVRAASRFDVDTIDPGVNLGFGGAVNVAADRHPDSAILILNDDVGVPTMAAAEISSRISRATAGEIVLFHAHRADSALGPPSASGTLLRVSGLWGLRRWLPRRLRGRAAPFYAAYVGSSAWSRLGGFAVDRYPLYFEDADFLARALKSGIPVTSHHAPLVLRVSETSRHYPQTVVCVAVGAANYLEQHGGWRRPMATAAVRVALLVRFAAEALRGRTIDARASARLAVTRAQGWTPSLPPYDGEPRDGNDGGPDRSAPAPAPSTP